MNNDKVYEIVNKLLQEKVFEYNGKLQYSVSLPIHIKYKINIIGDKSLLVMGRPTNFINVELDFLEIKPEQISDIFKGLDSRLKVDDRVWFLAARIKEDIEYNLKFFSLYDDVTIERINLNKSLYQINESKSEKRNVVRDLVNDVIKVFKKEGPGEYSLPEDLYGEMMYNFDNLQTEFSLELRIVESDYVDGFELDGGFYSDEDTIEIEIVYNPVYLPQLYYDIVGQLNETIRHELEHLLQAEKGEDIESDEENPKKYYLQPHELKAQIAGLKRLSKIRNQPFEMVVRDWFYKNENKHGLSKKDSEKIIKKIIEFYNYGKI